MENELVADTTVAETPTESPVVADQTAEPAPAQSEEPAKPKVDPVQRRIDRLTREKYELRGRLEALERMQQVQQPVSTARTTGEPKLADFDNVEDFFKANAQWEIRNAWEAKEAAERQAQAQRKAAEISDSWSNRLKSVKQAVPDFDEVIDSADISVTPEMGRALMESDMGPQIAYYLARNPEEADRMAGMSPSELNRSIGRIEAKLESERLAAKTQSSAPKPVNPVSGRGTGSKSLDDMAYDDFVKRRRQQVAARR